MDQGIILIKHLIVASRPNPCATTVIVHGIFCFKDWMLSLADAYHRVKGAKGRRAM